MNESSCNDCSEKRQTVGVNDPFFQCHRVAIRFFFRSNGSIYSPRGSWKMQKEVHMIIYDILVLLTIAFFLKFFRTHDRIKSEIRRKNRWKNAAPLAVAGNFHGEPNGNGKCKPNPICHSAGRGFFICVKHPVNIPGSQRSP